jgi:hypothetical protein
MAAFRIPPRAFACERQSARALMAGSRDIAPTAMVPRLPARKAFPSTKRMMGS